MHCIFLMFHYGRDGWFSFINYDKLENESILSKIFYLLHPIRNEPNKTFQINMGGSKVTRKEKHAIIIGRIPSVSPKVISQQDRKDIYSKR